MDNMLLYLMFFLVGGGADVLSISADRTISTTTGNESAHVQRLEPTGAHRNVNLPVASRAILGLPYLVQNTGSTYNLVLKNGSGGSNVVTVAPGRTVLVIVWFDGTSTYAWTYLNLGGSTAATNSAYTGTSGSTGSAGTGNTGSAAASTTASSTTATNNAVTIAAHVAISAPAAASNTAVHANYDASSANTWTGTFTPPVVPRNVTATFSASWDGGNIVVNGTDQFDQAITETISASAGATVNGIKVFKTVTGATKASVGTAGQTCSLGTGNKLGLSPAVAAPVGSLAVDGASEPCVFDATYSGVTPNVNTPNGTRVYHALYPQAVTVVQAAHTHTVTDAGHTHTGPSHSHTVSITDPGHSHT